MSRFDVLGDPSPLNRLSFTVTNRPLEVIRYWRNENWLSLDPPYQRGDVWGRTRRVNLIRSLLIGVPIPAIVVNDRYRSGFGSSEGYAVIDGRQRCMTILSFLDSELSIPGHWVGMSGSVYFSDLTAIAQRQIRDCEIGVCEARLKTVEEEAEVFELINFGGVPQGQSDLD